MYYILGYKLFTQDYLVSFSSVAGRVLNTNIKNVHRYVVSLI